MVVAQDKGSRGLLTLLSFAGGWLGIALPEPYFRVESSLLCVPECMTEQLTSCNLKRRCGQEVRCGGDQSLVPQAFCLGKER